LRSSRERPLGTEGAEDGRSEDAADNAEIIVSTRALSSEGNVGLVIQLGGNVFKGRSSIEVLEICSCNRNSPDSRSDDHQPLLGILTLNKPGLQTWLKQKLMVNVELRSNPKPRKVGPTRSWNV